MRQVSAIQLDGPVDLHGLDLVVHNSLILIVVAGPVVDDVGGGLTGQEQHVVVLVGHQGVRAGDDEHGGHDVAGLAVPVGRDLLLRIIDARTTNAEVLRLDRGSVLHAGVGSVILGLIPHHEHGLAVGIDGVLAVAGTTGGDPGHVVLQVEGGGVRHRLGQLDFLQDVLVILVHLVGDDIILADVLVVLVVLAQVDRLDRAVGQDQLGTVAGEAAVLGTLDLQNQGVVAVILLADGDDIAVGVQIDGVVQVHADGAQQVGSHGGGGLVLSVIHGDGAVVLIVGLVDHLGHSAGGLLGQHHRLDLVLRLGEGIQHLGLIIELLSGLKLLGAGSASRLIAVGVDSGDDLHIGVTLVSGFHGLADLADIGLHLGDGDIALVVVIVDLGQHAVGGIAHLGVAALADSQGVVIGLVRAIDKHSYVLLVNRVAQAQILIDVASFDLSGVGGVGLLGIGADLLGLQRPDIGGAAKGIFTIGQLQIVEVLFGELHLVIIADGLVLGIVGNILPAGSGVDGNVAHNDGVLLVILHHSGLQHVEGVQAGLLTGHGAAADEVIVAVVQADADGLFDNVNLPVGAGVVLDGAVIAQSAQQHLHEGIAGQAAGGTEGAVAVAGNDALLRAVGDVAREHVGGGNILEGSGGSAQSAGGGGAEDQVADDLRSRAAGQRPVGTEAAVTVAVHNPQSGDDVNGFFVIDVAVVVEVLGTGADGNQRHGHHQSEHQRKELLHVVCTSL